MSEQLETLVRDTFHDVARATHADESFLARLTREATNAPNRSRRTRWLAPVSIAAAVVALALLISFVARPSSHPRPTPPIQTGPTSPTPSPSSVVESMLQRCTVPEPETWISGTRQVPAPAVPGFANAPTSAGLTLLAMTPAGDAVVYSDGFTPSASNGALDLVRPDGTVTMLYAIPAPPVGQNSTSVATAQTDGRWVVFDLADTAGSRTEIDAVNLGTGAEIGITTAQPGRQLSAPQLVSGTAYWSDSKTNTPDSAVLYGYNLTARHQATVAAGNIVNPTALGGALAWTRNQTIQWLGTPNLPRGYPVNPVKPYPLIQNGQSAAWTDWNDSGEKPLPTVMVERSNTGQPKVAYQGTAAPASVQTQPTPLALTGNYLVYHDGTTLLALDLQTGAAIQLAPYTAGFVRAQASNGVLALDYLGSKGGSQLALLQPSQLPEPHC